MMPTCEVLIKEIADCLNAQMKSRKVPRSFYVSEDVVVPKTNCTQVGSSGNIFVFHVEVKSTDFNAGIRETINNTLAEKWNTSIIFFEFTGSNDTDIVCNVPGSGRVPIESRIASATQAPAGCTRGQHGCASDPAGPRTGWGDRGFGLRRELLELHRGSPS